MVRAVGALLLLSTAACGPGVRAAGHTKTGEDAGEHPPSATQVTTTGEVPLLANNAEQSAPTKSVATRPVLYAEVPEGGRLIGTTGGIAVEGVGRGGHWIAVCQADPSDPQKLTPRGDWVQSPALSLHVGAMSQRIDALLRYDRSGRYLVVLRDNDPFLLDAVSGDEASLSSLSPDLRHDELSDHRAFAFTEGGLAVLSEPKTGEKEQRGYYVPLFEDGVDTKTAVDDALEVSWGERPVWRIEGGPQHVTATTVPEGSSDKAWPVPASPRPLFRCGSPVTSYRAYERLTAHRPDPTLEVSWIEVRSVEPTTKKLQADPAPGFVMGVGDRWVRREDSGRLVLVDGKIQKQIASARCGARILRADAPSGLFLVACEEYAPKPPKSDNRKGKPKYRFDLYLIRPGFVRGLQADIMRTGVDYAGPPTQGLFVVRPGAEAALVDFGARTMTTIPGTVQILATNHESALVRRDNHFSLWTKGKETAVEFAAPTLAPVLVAGKAASVGKTMFLLDRHLLRWDLPGAPLAITEQGYALIPKKAATPGRLPEGPLLLLGPPEEKPEE